MPIEFSFLVNLNWQYTNITTKFSKQQQNWNIFLLLCHLSIGIYGFLFRCLSGKYYNSWPINQYLILVFVYFISLEKNCAATIVVRLTVYISPSFEISCNQFDTAIHFYRCSHFGLISLITWCNDIIVGLGTFSSVHTDTMCPLPYFYSCRNSRHSQSAWSACVIIIAN